MEQPSGWGPATRNFPRRQRTGPIALGSLGGALAVVLLLGAATAAPTGGVVLTAPYKTAHVTHYNSNTTAGCAGGRVDRKSYFNKSRGDGGLADNASGIWCNSYSANSATFEGAFNVSVPIRVAASGPTSIVVKWTLRANGSANITAGRCISRTVTGTVTCARSAKVFVNDSAVLVDLTNGSRLLPTYTWPGESIRVYEDTSCANTRCSSNGSMNASANLTIGPVYGSVYLNLSFLNASHHYLLELGILGGVKVDLSATGIAAIIGGAASATLNAGTHGKRVALHSITIS